MTSDHCIIQHRQRKKLFEVGFFSSLSSEFFIKHLLGDNTFPRPWGYQEAFVNFRTWAAFPVFQRDR